MAVTQEEKQAEVKKLKNVVHEMGEIIQELRVKEANELHIEDIKKTLNRYWYNNRQMRMFAGGLRKNGATMMDLVN